MKSIHSFLFLSAFLLLIAWIVWPEQNTSDSPTRGESGFLEPAKLRPATLEEAKTSTPMRTQERVALLKAELHFPLAPLRPEGPEEDTGKVSVRIVDSVGHHVYRGEVLILQHHKILQTLAPHKEDGLFHCELPANEAYEFMVKPDSLDSGLLPQLLRSRGTQKDRALKDPYNLEHFARVYVRLKAHDNLSLDLKVGTAVRPYGQVIGPSGNPLEGIMVVLSALDQEASGLTEASMTKEDGRFAFEEIFPGNHRLMFHVAHGKVPNGESWNPSAPRDVELLPGQDMDLGVIQIGGGQCSVSGWIVNQEGQPFAGLPLLCFSNQEVEERLNPHTFASELGRTVTNAEGHFSLTGLEAGPVIISLTPEYNPRFVLGAGHPAMWEPNVEVALSSATPHVNLGGLTVQESRPFLLTGNLRFDDAWLASEGHRKADLRIYISQVKGEALPEGVRRNAVRKQRVPIEWTTNSYRSDIETPMTPLTLTFKLKAYPELSFPVRPEALQTWVQDIHIPSDFE